MSQDQKLPFIKPRTAISSFPKPDLEKENLCKFYSFLFSASVKEFTVSGIQILCPSLRTRKLDRKLPNLHQCENVTTHPAEDQLLGEEFEVY